MLPQDYKPKNYDSFDREPWEEYAARLAIPADEATRQFFRQVAYDHLDHFNEHYPDFDLSQYRIGLETFTAREAHDLIRYFGNKPMDWWADQYEDFAKKDYPYIIYQKMSQDLTPPFPPILIEPTRLVDSGWRVYGRPMHLIEGTHRVGYLRHMLAKGIITPESSHSFVVLRPRDGSES